MPKCASRIQVSWLIVGVVTMWLAGCGYMSYKAYYVPKDVRAMGRELITSRADHLFVGMIGDFQVLVSFWPVWERDVRECFDVRVTFRRSSVIGEIDGAGQEDSLSTAPVAAVDTVIVRSKLTGTIWKLPQGDSWHRANKIMYGFERLCLERKHSRITVQFLARMENSEGEQVESRMYEMELVRWEDRNWGGLE